MPDNNNVHEVWSERELDDAMAALYANATVNREAQARARAQLLLAANAGETPQNSTTMPQPAVKTRRAVPLAAAAAVVALVAVGAVLVTQNSSPDEIGPAQSTSTFAPTRPPATTGSQHAPMPAMPDKPQNSLNVLATRVSETPLAPGQYRYVSAQGWTRVSAEGISGTTYAYLAEYRTERWIPMDQRQEWMARNQSTGNRQWIKGTEQAALADGVRIDQKLVMPDGEVRAPCGYFMANKSEQPCAEQPVGTVLTVAGPVQAPADGARLYQMLADTSATHADPPLQFFRTASDLFDGRFPAAVRRAALEALSRHPYLRVVDATTQDNRPAVSVSIDYAEGRVREELLLDPANGQLIGTREAYLKDADGIKAGEMVREGVRHEAVVDRIGAQPTR